MERYPPRNDTACTKEFMPGPELMNWVGSKIRNKAVDEKIARLPTAESLSFLFGYQVLGSALLAYLGSPSIIVKAVRTPHRA